MSTTKSKFNSTYGNEVDGCEIKINRRYPAWTKYKKWV